MKRHIHICVLVFSALKMNAQDTLNFPPPIVAPIIYAIETNENIAVDGKLNEPVWQQAPVVKDFFRIEPRQGGNYLYETFVKIVFDKKYLYLGVFCKDSLGKKGVRVQDLRRDFAFSNNDNFYVSIDAQNTKRFCISLMTTPYGNVRDAQVFDDAFRDADWDALWKVRTNITDSGWYAEYAIPFSTIRYNKSSSADSLSWGISFSRLTVRNYEQIAFPAVPQSFTPQRMNYAAQLKGLKLPPPSTNIRIQPYTLFQYDNSVNSNSISSSKTTIKPGGEVKWAINPQSVLDVTFNTDFAQADVDRAVNNLTRFNILFPERRQFFLENSGIYAGTDVRGLKPFFSRSIGLSNTQFDAKPVPIDAGVRFTNRTQKQSFAGLYAHQQGTDVQGAANFGVLRYLKNYNKQSNIGVMLTHRLDEENAAKGFEQRNNTTLTLDGFIRPKDQFNIQYLITASRNNTNDSIGLAGNFWIEYTPTKLYAFWKTQYIDEKYLPGMGFISASNTFYNNGGGYLIWRPAKGKLGKWIRRWDPGIFIETYQDAKTMKFQSGSIYLFPVYIFFKNNFFIEYSLYPTWEHFYFTPLGFSVAPAKYFFVRQQVRSSTDASKKISVGINYLWGNYYDGKLDEINIDARIAPTPKVAFTASYQLNKVRNLGINKINEDISLWTGGVRLATNPRLQLSGLYQYNTFDKRGRLNIRGSWEFAPLSFLYIVFNESNFQNSHLKNKSFISKLTYLKQF